MTVDLKHHFCNDECARAFVGVAQQEERESSKFQVGGSRPSVDVVSK